jgi:hypothetical protein
MKKRVRVYKRKQQMKNGGPTANITQDSQLDPIPEQRTNKFSSWLQNSAVMGAEREKQKQYEEFLKSMSKGGAPSAIPGYAGGGSMLSPGAYDEGSMMKENTHLAFYQDAYNKDQKSTENFMGDLGTIGATTAGIMGQPDVYKYEGDTVNPFGEGVDMTGMEITGIEEGKNKRHRTMKYNATGTPSAPGKTQEEAWNDPNMTDEQYESFMGGDERKHPKLNDAWLKTKQGIGNAADKTGNAFQNAWYKMQQGRPEQMQDGGQDCPVGYKKDFKGQCVSQITGEPMADEAPSLENPGLENPFAQKQPNPLTGETPMGFDATGKQYENNGIGNFGDAGQNPEDGSGLKTQGELDLVKQSKLKTFDENNPYAKGELIPAVGNAIAWIGEGDERVQNEQRLRKKISDPFNVYRTMGADRGDRMANVPGFGNELKPDDHTRWGRDTKVAQDGIDVRKEDTNRWGEMLNGMSNDDIRSKMPYMPKAWDIITQPTVDPASWDRNFGQNIDIVNDYQQRLMQEQDGGGVNIGDEQEMSDEEIQRLLAQGYQLEFID